MPITEFLEKNAAQYGNDVCLVEVNPQIQEKKQMLWKDYDLIQPTSSFWYRREITWHVFNEKATVLHNCLWAAVSKKETRLRFC